MRRLPTVLLLLTLLAGIPLPAQATESPPRSPSPEIARIAGELWNLALRLFADLGSEVELNGSETPQGDLGSDMDPNG
jgi:hypothetical protein